MAELPAPVTAALRRLPAPACAYVYDTASLVTRANRLRAALPPNTSFLYAVKANGHPGVVTALAGAADGLEVASGGELALAVAAGARRIVVGGPAKTDTELAAAVRAGALINVESAHEMRRMAGLGLTADICVRVNRAGTALHGSHAMTGVPTPFGVDEAQLPGLLADVPDGLRVIGFHLHAVSNNLDGPAHAAFLRDALDWSVRIAARHQVGLRVVNAGGGFGVDYETQASMDVTALSDVSVPAGVELLLEPGRWLTADAGWYAAEVLDLKTTHGRTFAVLRGGTHHFRLPAAWGYSHPFTVLPVDDWNRTYPRPAVTDTPIDAVGELCTPRDVLTRGQHVTRLRAGDLLVFGRAGAYGWDISHHDFLRHDPPEFVILPS
ncbi:putative diaminopimelate decarboxylase [Actinoplanes missouriensis 431]|uniref:Putative diaminopimelate decarboxylase n=1 Tax=Actinoplanes missouriensis (strain ATCC 14538 / DSM 43046 / CBS 188.64 / JCM 3121 / NBRC 102363 / NCIMB 12654 / NRRL B-3342 / UNCC 431) TaxID=512565 RepID=I0H8S1_ACTM4|nr:decarboxylase [Actinoplanes missouriensis]BAL89408.1 putative diaminopimelate decarboxylase [Actinoplanes missouriensis 431]